MMRLMFVMVFLVLFFTGRHASNAYAGALDKAPGLSATLLADQHYRDILANLPSERSGAFSSWRMDEQRERFEDAPRVGFRLDEARRVSPYFIVAVLVAHFGEMFLPDQVHVFVTDTISDREKFRFKRDYRFLGRELNVTVRFPRRVGVEWVVAHF